MFRTNSEANAVEMFPGIVRRTLGSGDRTTLAEISLLRGAVVPAHSHPHEQIGYVASGRVLFEIGGESRELANGDGYVIPGDVAHQVMALEDAICIDVFSPVREEFL